MTWESRQHAKKAMDTIEDAIADLSDIWINFDNVHCTNDLIKLAGHLKNLRDDEFESLRDAANNHDPSHGVDTSFIWEFLEARE